MAQDPDKPKDNGKIGLPKISGGMNRMPPAKNKFGGKGAKKDKEGGIDDKPKQRRKRTDEQVMDRPALSATSGDDDPVQVEGDESDLGTAQGKTTKEEMDPEEKEKLLSRIRKRFDRAALSEADNRKSALEDLKFKKGDQWPADIQAQRNFDKRPCLTINKLPTFVHQVTNDQRQNRPCINVNPVGDRGDVDGAKMYRGVIRAIERASTADIAYDTAFESAASAGLGYFRIATEYEDADGFDQVLAIKRIRNPFTVYLDCDRMEPDGSDAMWGFVTEMMPRDEFKEEYPDMNPVPFAQSGIGEMMKNWATDSLVRVAEYYEVKLEKKTLVKLSNGWVGWEDKIDDDVWTAIQDGHIDIVAERESGCPIVHWYKVTALDVLEHGPTVFRWIPIIPVVGDEIDIEGKVTYSGIIRHAKDPQRMYNYWSTAETELVALAPKAPWIMEEGQVEGHEDKWKQANIKSYPYLLYRNVNVNGQNAPAPQRQPFAGSPGGVVTAKQGAAQDMIATTGIRFDATKHERTTDESGIALQEIRSITDIGSFHYIDNLGRALKHAGRILIDAIPKVYDQRRVLTILREDDKEETIQIDPSATKGVMDGRDPATGKGRRVFNPTIGKYGVTVTVGPSYATKRIETAKSMMAFARALPQTAGVIADLIAKNQDWPGAEEMATRLAKVVAMQHPGVLTPDMKDVPPQVQAMLTALDTQVKQLSMERQQMVLALKDKAADRAIDMEKINKDFEAKVLAVVAKVETQTAATHQKAISSFETHISAEMKALGGQVGDMLKAMAKGVPMPEPGVPDPEPIEGAPTSAP